MIKKVSFFIFLLATFSSYSQSTNAATVTYDGGTGYATGILGLVVDSTTYNVDFVAGSYDSIYGASLPAFFGDATGSDNAANAIMSTLNAELTVPQIAIGTSEVLWVAYLTSASANDFQARQVGHVSDAAAWQRFSDFLGDRGTDFSDAPTSWLFATFTPSAVPVPAAVWLFGTALIGLAGFSKRRKSA
jgi:hypothetical protein